MNFSGHLSASLFLQNHFDQPLLETRFLVLNSLFHCSCQSYDTLRNRGECSGETLSQGNRNTRRSDEASEVTLSPTNYYYTNYVYART